jgi:hypothetical protein
MNRWSHSECYQIFKEEVTLILLKYFRKRERKETTLPNSFYEVSSTLTPKLGKDMKKKGNL